VASSLEVAAVSARRELTRPERMSAVDIVGDEAADLGPENDVHRWFIHAGRLANGVYPAWFLPLGWQGELRQLDDPSN
jgi:hypothetical protein